LESSDRATDLLRRRYDRIAPLYDFVEGLVERPGHSRWRSLLWSKVEGTQVLEIGVGTGQNFSYYPPDVAVTAIDLSGAMLKRAEARAGEMGLSLRLHQMDAQRLRFEDNSFDTVVASFVFCSVPDPVRGLAEAGRVCRPGGKVVLLEHVLSANRVLARLMNLANPVAVWVGREHINRRTLDSVARSGLAVQEVTELALGIVKLVEARKKTPPR